MSNQAPMFVDNQTKRPSADQKNFFHRPGDMKVFAGNYNFAINPRPGLFQFGNPPDDNREEADE